MVALEFFFSKIIERIHTAHSIADWDEAAVSHTVKTYIVFF